MSLFVGAASGGQNARKQELQLLVEQCLRFAMKSPQERKDTLDEFHALRAKVMQSKRDDLGGDNSALQDLVSVDEVGGLRRRVGFNLDRSTSWYSAPSPSDIRTGTGSRGIIDITSPYTGGTVSARASAVASTSMTDSDEQNEDSDREGKSSKKAARTAELSAELTARYDDSKLQSRPIRRSSSTSESSGSGSAGSVIQLPVISYAAGPPSPTGSDRSKGSQNSRASPEPLLVGESREGTTPIADPRMFVRVDEQSDDGGNPSSDENVIIHTDSHGSHYGTL